MKTIIPVKFIICLTIFCLIIFPVFAFVLFYVIVDLITVDKMPLYCIIIFLLIGIGCEICFLKASDYCKLILENGTITNYVFDGTRNDGWCESVSNVKKVKLVGKKEVQKYYKQFKRKKAILIDFGNYNIKYIYAGLFSKRQIKEIMDFIVKQGDKK